MNQNKKIKEAIQIYIRKKRRKKHFSSKEGI